MGKVTLTNNSDSNVQVTEGNSNIHHPHLLEPGKTMTIKADNNAIYYECVLYKLPDNKKLGSFSSGDFQRLSAIEISKDFVLMESPRETESFRGKMRSAIRGAFPSKAGTSSDLKENPREETVGDENPHEENPGKEIALEEIAREENPGEEIAREENPGEEIAHEENPGKEIAREENPRKEIARKENPRKEIAHEENPREENPHKEIARKEKDRTPSEAGSTPEDADTGTSVKTDTQTAANAQSPP